MRLFLASLASIFIAARSQNALEGPLLRGSLFGDPDPSAKFLTISGLSTDNIERDLKRCKQYRPEWEYDPYYRRCWAKRSPSASPSASPSTPPSITTLPTTSPSLSPTHLPTLIPSSIPSKLPSELPSLIPSSLPSLTPTITTSADPTVLPSHLPTSSPSVNLSTTVLTTTSSPQLSTQIPTAAPTISDTIAVRLPVFIIELTFRSRRRNLLDIDTDALAGVLRIHLNDLFQTHFPLNFDTVFVEMTGGTQSATSGVTILTHAFTGNALFYDHTVNSEPSVSELETLLLLSFQNDSQFRSQLQQSGDPILASTERVYVTAVSVQTEERTDPAAPASEPQDHSKSGQSLVRAAILMTIAATIIFLAVLLFFFFRNREFSKKKKKNCATPRTMSDEFSPHTVPSKKYFQEFEDEPSVVNVLEGKDARSVGSSAPDVPTSGAIFTTCRVGSGDENYPPPPSIQGSEHSGTDTDDASSANLSSLDAKRYGMVLQIGHDSNGARTLEATSVQLKNVWRNIDDNFDSDESPIKAREIAVNDLSSAESTPAKSDTMSTRLPRDEDSDGMGSLYFSQPPEMSASFTMELIKDLSHSFKPEDSQSDLSTVDDNVFGTNMLPEMHSEGEGDDFMEDQDLLLEMSTQKGAKTTASLILPLSSYQSPSGDSFQYSVSTTQSQDESKNISNSDDDIQSHLSCLS